VFTPRIAVCLGLTVLAPLVQAQTAPSSYTITQNISSAAGATSTVYRSGSKALAVVSLPAQGATPATRTDSLYDIAAGTHYTWNPDVSPIACGAGTFSGDWGDPFALTAEVNKDIASGEVKPAGSETIHGIPTQIYAGSNAQATEKVWLDKKDSLVVRAQLSGPGAPLMTIVDITSLSLAAPDPALFVLPPECASQKPQRTPAQLITDETGDDPANFVSAFTGPGSKIECDVVLRVVQAKTMAPLADVQVAIDTQYDQNDPNPPHYEFGVGNDGTETFAGGHLHQVTAGIHNGVVDLGNSLPPYFNMVVNAVHPGHSGGPGLIYRQCFAPTTVLLFLYKDYGQADESVDALWVKAGRYAKPPAR
jgi:hypothetical protein